MHPSKKFDEIITRTHTRNKSKGVHNVRNLRTKMSKVFPSTSHDTGSIILDKHWLTSESAYSLATRA